jgi:hypothetical protein
VKFAACAALLALAAPLSAAPVLRLSNSAVVVAVGLGANAPAQTIQATNIGDGALTLSVSVESETAWLYASVQLGGNIVLAFFTAGLPRGAYTAVATVSDPDAIDSPQTVTVTVQVGGAPPYVVDQYIAPGQTKQILSRSNQCSQCQSLSLPAITATTQDGGTWLEVSIYSAGTFGFRFGNVSVYLAPASDMASGTYSGTVQEPGQTIPVTMRLTTQPIAVPSTAELDLRLAQNGPAITAPFLPPISVSNSGMGDLAITGISTDHPAVRASIQGNQVALTVDPGSLPAGTYTGSVTILCNAANCPMQIPVVLQVIPRGPPLVFYRGVVSNTDFKSAVVPGGVAAVFGEQLSFSPPVIASDTPLPIALDGTTVLVNDVFAPLYYSSYGQVAFQVPPATVPGTALVQVIRDGQASNLVTVQVGH